MTERVRQSLKFGMSPEATTPAGALTAKTESQTLAVANQNRVALYVTNNGAKNVWLAYGPTATAEKGPLLVEKTGAIVIDNYFGIVTCITKEGESLITFAEI